MQGVQKRRSAVTSVTETTRSVVLGCHGRRTIRCLLIKGGNAGEDGGNEVSCCSG